MKYKIVKKTDTMENIPDGTFVYAKDIQKGFIKKNISVLGTADFKFETIINEIEKQSYGQAVANGLDSVFFEQKLIKHSHKSTRRVKKRLDERGQKPEADVINEALTNGEYFDPDALGIVLPAWTPDTPCNGESAPAATPAELLTESDTTITQLNETIASLEAIKTTLISADTVSTNTTTSATEAQANVLATDTASQTCATNTAEMNVVAANLKLAAAETSLKNAQEVEAAIVEAVETSQAAVDAAVTAGTDTTDAQANLDAATTAQTETATAVTEATQSVTEATTAVSAAETLQTETAAVVAAAEEVAAAAEVVETPPTDDDLLVFD